MEVLDVGCGYGDLMEDLTSRGCVVKGVEISPEAVKVALEKGLEVEQGVAEALPYPDASFDAVVCSVVLPYTDEGKTITEWARVLKPGGFVQATYHGVGYGLWRMDDGPETTWRTRVYASRFLANTLIYRSTGLRLPGHLGDTLCQTRGSLQRYYRQAGLVLEREVVVEKRMGLPVFLGHRLVRPTS